MKIVFLINHRASYRYFASIIDEGIKIGCKIELWHNYFSIKKGIEIEYSPFISSDYSGIKYKKIISKEDLINNIIKSQNVDFFVDINPVTFPLDNQLKKKIDGKWCIIMHGLDSYMTIWHWQHFPFDGKLLQKYDRLFFPYTRRFYEDSIMWLKKFADRRGLDNYKFFDSKHTKVYPIGFPVYNNKKNDIDNGNVREKYGIPNGKKILIYLPFAYYPARWKKIKYKSLEAAFSGLFISSSRNKKNKSLLMKLKSLVINIIKKCIYLFFALLNKQARLLLIRKWNEPAIIKQIKKFCNNNDLLLVVKPRTKFPFSEAVYKYANIIIDDDETQHYPSRLQELISLSQIVVGFHTTAVFEVVAGDSNYVNIELPPGFFGDEKSRIEIHKSSYPSIYNFPGTAENIKIPNMISEFGNKKLSDFDFNKTARKDYMKIFLGSINPTPAQNFFDYLNSQ